MAVTTKILFPATSNATTTDFSLSGLELNNQDDLDVYVTLSGGTRRLGLRQSTDTTAIASHPQVNNTDGLYYPPVSVGDQLKNYTLVNNNSTVRFNNALPTGSIVFVERRTRDASGSYTNFASGSTIRASELNRAFDEANFTAQEARNKAFDLEGKIYNALGTANTVVKTTDTGSVTSTMITDGTIVNADINASANIQGSKLLNDSVTLDKLGAGALPTDITIASANITNGTIINEDINGSAAIAGTKVTPSFGSQNLSTTGTAATGALTVTGNIAVSGTVDGRDVATDGTKLDGVEVGATGDQTNAEIRAAVEAASDSNVFTDADHSKLNAIEPSATADQTAGEIKTLLQSDKLTNAEIATGTLDGRYYTEAELNGGQLNSLYFTEAELTGGAIDGRYYTETELNAGQLDNRYFTETELTGGALDGRYYTETEAEARFLRQDSSETIASGVTWSNSDAHVATTAAINARIVDLIDDVGGFIAIANQTSFPATNPQGTAGQAAILSVGATTATLTPSGTTVTIANGAGSGNTVTVTGVPSVIPNGFGFLVESTNTTHTYTFHRLVPKATEVTTVATNITNIAAAGANVADINNFADIYQIASSAPTQRADGTSLQEGDLWFDNSNDNLTVWNGSAFATITPSQSVLDDVAIVSGAITYSEDLGLITNAVTTGSSNGSLEIVADALEDEITFTVTASGGAYFIDGVSKPALTLYKGWTYTFDLSSNTLGSHPLRFSSGGSAYNTNVTVTGTQGSAGAKVSIKIPESQPTSFAYYCTNHSGMGNTITVKDDPIKTVSDDIVKIKAVADNSTNINAVNSNKTNIDAVAGNQSNINSAVSNASNINSAVSNASNINSAVSNASNINTVAGNNSNITAVANNSSNINSAVSNASNINTVAGSISNVNIVGSNISNVNNFTDKYQIASSDPSTDGGGNALAAGDLYFNTSANELKVYSGSAWQGGVTATGNFATKTGNTFTGDNIYNDNVKAKFGSDTDLEIYHNNTNAIIENSTGDIIFKHGTENLAIFRDDGACVFNFDDTKRLETTNTGATVTGLMTATTIDGAAGDNLQLDFGTL